MVSKKIKSGSALAFSTLALVAGSSESKATPKIENTYPLSSAGECLSDTGEYTPLRLARVAGALQLFHFTRLEYCQEAPIDQPPIESIGVYDPANPYSIHDEGSISVAGVFTIICKSPDFKPPYMVVQDLSTHNGGAINIGADTQTLLNESPQVPICAPPLPSRTQ